VSATAANDGTDHTELQVLVKSGDKQQHFQLVVKPAADDHFSLIKFSQHAAVPETS
jgi:hypothetical protein